MRKIVRNEPIIISFTYGTRELYREKDVSTILLIGEESQYLSYLHNDVIMNDYITEISLII